MDIIKESKTYILRYVRNTEEPGAYQILERIEGVTRPQVCGVYSNKRDALSDFTKLARANG
jgi:hypothetical protein